MTAKGETLRVVGPADGASRQNDAGGFLRRAAVMATASSALGIGLTTAYLQWRTAYRIPSWDAWGWIAQYRDIAERGLRLDDLSAQWNEHRLVFPRLVFLLDMAWARGSDAISRAVSDLLQCLTLAMIVGMARPASHGAPGAVMACFATILLFSAAQGENIYMGFQVQFVMVYSAAIVAVALAASVGKRTGDGAALKRLVASWCAATVATFSMANGLGAWLVVALLALLGRGIRPALATAALGIVEAAIYLHGYHRVSNPDHTGLADAAANLWACTSYLLTYLGAVMAPMDPALARLVGCATLLLAAWWGGRHRGRFAGPDPWPRFVVGVLLFVLFSAAVTTVGRFRLGDAQALSSRYLTPGAVMWSVLGMAVAIEIEGRLRSGARTFATVCLACVAAAIGVSDERLGIEVMTSQTADMPRASDAYVVGVKDSAALDEATTNIPLAWSMRPFLKDHGLGPFSETGASWLGQPVSSLLGGRTYVGCLGSIDDRTSVGEGDDAGVAIDGWAWDGRDGLPSRVLVADAAGSVVGLARPGMARADVQAAMPEVNSGLAGFRGYARASSGAKLRLLTVSHDGRALCEIGAGG